MAYQLRADRLLTLGIYNLRRTCGIRPGPCSIPILMYHSIGNHSRDNSHPYFCTETSLETFKTHLSYLYHQNYTVIRLKEIQEYLKKPLASGAKLAVLTFDDGFADFYSAAFPAMEQHRFTATVFLPTAFLDKENAGLAGKKHLSWRQVRELDEKGIDFGSHTVDHPHLADLGHDDIDFQLTRSKKEIEDHLGKPVECFAYPYAFPDGKKDIISFLRSVLERRKYSVGVSTKIGTASRRDDIFSLKRLPVNEFDDLPLFIAKLNGSYDWLRLPQMVVKRIKNAQHNA